MSERLSKGARIHLRREKANHRDDELRARMTQQARDAAAKRALLAAEEAERNKQRQQEEKRRAETRKQEINRRLDGISLRFGEVYSWGDQITLPSLLEYAEWKVELTWLGYKLGEFGRRAHADRLGYLLNDLPLSAQRMLEEDIVSATGKRTSRLMDIRDRVLTPEEIKRYSEDIK